MIKGFKITNANFRQENVNLPKGIYTYGVTVRPVGTTLIFKVGAEIFTVPGLQAGVLTRVAHTFTTIQDATVFYPSITVGDQIFEPMLEVGTNASSPQANYLDDNDLVSEAGLKITNETAELYASKSYVNSSIIVSADNITSEVSNQISGLSTSITQTTNNISARVNTVEEGLRDTGIDITDKKMILTANNVIFKGNNPEDVGKVEIMEGGNIKTVDADIEGKITATSGKIAGLNIYNNSISTLNEELNLITGDNIHISKEEIFLREYSLDMVDGLVREFGKSVDMDKDMISISGRYRVGSSVQYDSRVVIDRSSVMVEDVKSGHSMEIKADGIYKNGIKIL